MGIFNFLKVKRPDDARRCSAGDQNKDDASPDPATLQPAETKKATRAHDFQSLPGPLSYPLPTENPPPYPHEASTPDASLRPPPPGFGHKRSKINATWDDAARAHAFCDQFPPYVLPQTAAAEQEAVRKGNIELQRPKEYAGELKAVRGVPGLWSARSSKWCGDCVLLSNFVGIDRNSEEMLCTCSSLCRQC